MFGIKEEFIKELENCSWMVNCVSYDLVDFHFDVQIAKDKTEAMRSVKTLAWENAWIGVKGDLDSFIFVNAREELSKWRGDENLIDGLEMKYVLPIASKVEKIMDKNKFEKEVFYSFKTAIFTLLQLNYYSEIGLKSRFLDKVWEIYMKGWIPCGIMGERDTGKILIY